ncbi:MAG TPA: ribonuclease H-like domain-containing protein [candidate division Zixibacteria bacterium]|nr:ribonuclease H-like domain-containing protein [candidate division Zixibacteria bacterium]
MKSRLKRLSGQLPSGGAAAAGKARTTATRGDALRKALGGEVVVRDNGEFVLVRRRHSGRYAHGRLTVADFLRRDDYCVSHVNLRAEPQPLDKKQFVFFDTETTGLGGAGSLAFLVGVASISDGALETRQYLIPDFADETAMLEALLEEFTPDSVVVSYNGRSFDEPLVTDRLRINRVARQLPYQSHLDLLYPARSLFKRRIQDCSLTNVEARVFGHERDGDIPGYLIPGVYFDWVHEDKTEQLAAVIEHNRQDIVSLALLLSVFAESHTSDGRSLSEALDVYSLALRAQARKDHARAAEISREREDELAAVGDREVDFRRSLVYKRAGDWSAALPLWERLEAGRDRIAQAARLELAKWREHRERDFVGALRLTEKGIRFSLNHDRELADWRRRQIRLERRLAGLR